MLTMSMSGLSISNSFGGVVSLFGDFAVSFGSPSGDLVAEVTISMDSSSKEP